MRKLIYCFLLVSLFTFSLVASLPEPPASPSLGNNNSYQNSTSLGNLKNGSSYNNVKVNSGFNLTLIYFLVGLLVLVIVCLGVYYFLIKQKKDLNIIKDGEKNEKR